MGLGHLYLAKLTGFGSAFCEFETYTKPCARQWDIEMKNIKLLPSRRPQKWQRRSPAGTGHVQHWIVTKSHLQGTGPLGPDTQRRTHDGPECQR